MKEYSIGDIAKRLSKKYNVPIKIIGNRGNEKLHEKLMTDCEKEMMKECNDIYIIKQTKEEKK